MTSHEGQEVLLGKHSSLGEASCSTGVTESKALIWCNLESLMINDIVQLDLIDQLPEIEKSEPLLELFLHFRVQLLAKDEILQVCSTLQMEEIFGVGCAADAGRDVGVFQAVSKVGQS